MVRLKSCYSMGCPCLSVITYPKCSNGDSIQYSHVLYFACQHFSKLKIFVFEAIPIWFVLDKVIQAEQQHNPHAIRYLLLWPTLNCPYHKVQNFLEYLQHTHTHNAILIIIIILIIVMLSCHVMMIYRQNITTHLIIKQLDLKISSLVSISLKSSDSGTWVGRILLNPSESCYKHIFI